MKGEIKDIEFNSVFDLYKRVKPALNSKRVKKGKIRLHQRRRCMELFSKK